MAARCLVCYSELKTTDQLAYLNKDDIQFPSGKHILELFGQIFDVTKTEAVSQKYSQLICRQCLIKFVEYDEVAQQLSILKSNLKRQFVTSHNKFVGRATPRSNSDKIVTIKVPASKMIPLHRHYVSPRKGENVSQTSTTTKDSQNHITIDDTSFSEFIKMTNASDLPIMTIDGMSKNVIIDNHISNVTNSVDNQTKNNIEMGFVKIKPRMKEKNQEVSMDVDEECSFRNEPAQQSNENIQHHHVEDSTDSEALLNAGPLSSNEVSGTSSQIEENNSAVTNIDANEYVLGKVEILDAEDEEEEHTIVLESEDGSFISMVGGQKLLYDNEIALILPDIDTDQNQDNHDSNDESHIELQVSGDEETADAIIAATKEQGGAFIKTDSGEMYRVKAVKSSTVKINDISLEDIIDINDTQTVYTCLLCKKTTSNNGSTDPNMVFSTSTSISKHLKSLHNLYVCVVCRLITDNPAEYNKHVGTHDNMKGKYQCTICFKRFFSSNLLTQHMNQHTGTRPYSCPKCDKSFSSKYIFNTHLKIHQNRPRPFACTTCKKKFLSQQNLTQHMKIHNGIRDFVCNECGKGFSAKHNLDVHKVVHSGEKPFICGICNKGFARKAEIRDHIRTHTGERPFSCEICGASFSQRSNLLSHKRATHFDDKRYACEHCEKRFKRRRLLVYHVKACHTGERPYSCEECHATFVYPEHYKKHVKIHTGERPYSCEVCGKTFNSRDNRNAHRFIHSDKKPYECLVCGAGFMRKPQLYAHMTQQKHISESILVNEPRVPADITLDPNTVYEAVNEQELEAIQSSGDLSLIEAAELATVEAINDDPNLIENADLQNIQLEGTKILSEDGTESVVRLVQVQLPNGNNGWIALDQ